MAQPKGFISDKEFDEKIGFISDADFESNIGVQPETPPAPTPSKSLYGKTADVLGNFSVGVAKGGLSTLQNIGNVIAKPLNKLFGGKPEDIGIKPETLKPQGTAENIGYGAERGAEFLIPSSKIAQGTKAVTGLMKGTGLASNAGRLLTRSGIEAGVVGTQTAAQQGTFKEDAGTAAIVASLLPVGGAGLNKVIGAAGQKIQQSVLRPSLRDVEDGFKIENVTKYKLGGNLQQTLSKTNSLMNDLGQQLRTTLRESDVPIDLNAIYQNTARRLSGNKALNFGDNKGTARVLKGLIGEIKEVSPNGVVDLVNANLVKRGAGTKGAWVFGNVDPDAKATEKVYNAFYDELKTAIEKAGGPEIQKINKQLSELIPISNAAIRRIPVAERNNAIGLTDGIGIYAALFDPRALATMGALKLSKSGRFANTLTRLSESMKGTRYGQSVNQTPQTNAMTGNMSKPQSIPNPTTFSPEVQRPLNLK